MRDVIPSSGTETVERWHDILFWMFPTSKHEDPEAGSECWEVKAVSARLGTPGLE